MPELPRKHLVQTFAEHKMKVKFPKIKFFFKLQKKPS